MLRTSAAPDDIGVVIDHAVVEGRRT